MQKTTKNHLKWLTVIAVGFIAIVCLVAACTVSTVDLTQKGAQEHGYTVDKHIAQPWRMVPPVSDGHEDTLVGEESCQFVPQGEMCVFMETSTYTFKDRYATASTLGSWPLTVGLEYVCVRESKLRYSGYKVTMDGEEVTDLEILSRLPMRQRHETEPTHSTYVYYTLGGFTPGEGAIAVSIDGSPHLGYQSIYGEQGKYIEITDDFIIDGIRHAEATAEFKLVQGGPVPDEDIRGSVTFEMRGARSKFEAVDRLCTSAD